METKLEFNMQQQPDDSTCGPTCLHAMYRYHGDDIALSQVIDETATLPEGGTLGVFLANHALARGYEVSIYTYNLHVFDPSWFEVNHGQRARLQQGLRAQMQHKNDPKLHAASKAYIHFLDGGGRVRFVDLTTGLLSAHLVRGLPILTGLSATYLYRSRRETAASYVDDVRGEPVGHFVVLCGYDRRKRQVLVADPQAPTPHSDGHHYEIGVQRVLSAILLGVVTYDANLLMIWPKK